MKKIGVLLALLLSVNANAAFNMISHHSRANCGNNESISWDGRGPHLFWVNSLHVWNGSPYCNMSSGWVNTWRNAQVHWGEGRGGWTVIGTHFMYDENNKPKQVQYEMVKDCSIYNGWWDR